MPGVASRLAFSFLLERLRLHGFTAGTADCLRLQDLLDRMAGYCSPGDVKTLLCPIFARSREQQRIFYEVFDEFWIEAQLGVAAEPADTGLPAALESEEGTPRPQLRIRRLSAKTLAAVLTLALVLVVLAMYRLLEKPPLRVTAPLTEKTSVNGPSAPPETTHVTHEGIVTPSRFAGPLRTAAAAGAIAPLVWLASFLWIRRKDRKEADAVVRNYKPPYWWDVRPKATPLECYRTERFYNAARKLRLRLASGRKVLDLAATILATAKQRGYPEPQYRTVTRPADYLCLIRRNSPEDHRAGLFDALVAGLATEDVAVHRYFFETDVGVCTNMAGDQTRSLAELMRKYPVSAVLVFGDTADLFHPVRGDLLAWAEPDESGPPRALFTCGRPTPRQARMAAKAEVGIFPADVDGLLAFAELMSTGRKPAVEYIRSAQYAAAKPIPETPAELRTFLGRDAYALLCACAAYPKLDWNLTLYLGAALPGGRESLTEQALTRLVQLPWFQSGGLPERLRALLVRDLEPEQTSAVQRALAALLERDKPPEGTFASAACELQLAVFKAHGASGAGRARRLLGTLRLMPLEEVAPDTTLLQFLDLTAPNRRVAALPRKLRERLFRRGVPGLGWTTASWILAAALMASIAAGFFFGLRPDAGVRVVIAGRCVDREGVPVRPTLVHVVAKLAETPSFAWSPGDGGFQLRAHTAKHGALTVNFQGPKGTTVTMIASGALPFWNIVFPEPATPNLPDGSPSPASGKLLNAKQAQPRPTVRIIGGPSDPKAEIVREVVSKAGYQTAVMLGSDYLPFGIEKQVPLPSGVVYYDPEDLEHAQEIQKLVAVALARATAVHFDPRKADHLITVWMPADGAAAPLVATKAWDLIKDSKDAAFFDAFARTFPSSAMAGVARLRADQLRRAATAPQTAQAPTLSAAKLLPEVQDVYFDYENSSIRSDASAALSQDAAIFKQLHGQDRTLKVVIEGHADEKGTAEDQLGLGDRRAVAVKDYLVQLGVPADFLITISYGKERPVCTDLTEACFQRNSRVHFSPLQ